jgi:hypothetical protein
MALCAFCKTRETDLHESGLPICLECSEARSKRKPPATEQQIRNDLLQDILRSTSLTSEAAREFDCVMGQFPGGLPHPHGAQRIKNASHNLSVARKEMVKAHQRLNDFLNTGAAPQDLKKSARSGGST